MGRGHPPPPLRRIVRIGPVKRMNLRRIALFPLPGAILFPGMQLPLHIFEPRYRAMVAEAIARDQRIGMIQPSGPPETPDGPPPLFHIGCVGRMANIEAMEDGRFNLMLEGVARFTIIRELEVATPFRQAEVDFWGEPTEDDILPSIMRAAVEQESRAYADALGYSVDWDGVQKLDDTNLVNAIAQIAPFDVAAKQALLESRGLNERAELLCQLLSFFARQADGGDESPTLQ